MKKPRLRAKLCSGILCCAMLTPLLLANSVPNAEALGLFGDGTSLAERLESRRASGSSFLDRLDEAASDFEATRDERQEKIESVRDSVKSAAEQFSEAHPEVGERLTSAGEELREAAGVLEESLQDAAARTQSGERAGLFGAATDGENTEAGTEQAPVLDVTKRIEERRAERQERLAAVEERLNAADGSLSERLDEAAGRIEERREAGQERLGDLTQSLEERLDRLEGDRAEDLTKLKNDFENLDRRLQNSRAGRLRRLQNLRARLKTLKNRIENPREPLLFRIIKALCTPKDRPERQGLNLRRTDPAPVAQTAPVAAVAAEASTAEEPEEEATPVEEILEEQILEDVPDEETPLATPEPEHIQVTPWYRSTAFVTGILAVFGVGGISAIAAIKGLGKKRGLSPAQTA